MHARACLAGAAAGAAGGGHGPGEVKCPVPKNALECVLEKGLQPGVLYTVRNANI